MASLVRFMLVLVVPCLALFQGDDVDAQVVYYGAYRPMYAAPVVAAPAYVANYTPAGNYAAVTAYAPPVVAPASAVTVTSGFAPAMAAPMAVTSYYAPTTVYSPVVAAPVAEVVAAPVTAYYAPAAVAMPLYRRGLFGGLRPVRSAYFIGY